jgi:hypothetical protein
MIHPEHFSYLFQVVKFEVLKFDHPGFTSLMCGIFSLSLSQERSGAHLSKSHPWHISK